MYIAHNYYLDVYDEGRCTKSLKRLCLSRFKRLYTGETGIKRLHGRKKSV